jgi:hypothetical protein
METEFEVLTRWLPKINESVKAGQGIPGDFFCNFPRSKFNQNYINETFLAPLDRKNSSNDEWKKENIPDKRKRLFKIVNHLTNKEYYYIILYHVLLKQSYEEGLNRIIEYISNNLNGIQRILTLRHQVESPFNKAIREVAGIDSELTEKSAN